MLISQLLNTFLHEIHFASNELYINTSLNIQLMNLFLKFHNTTLFGIYYEYGRYYESKTVSPFHYANKQTVFHLLEVKLWNTGKHF